MRPSTSGKGIVCTSRSGADSWACTTLANKITASRKTLWSLFITGAAALSSKIFVEIVENCSCPLQSRFVVFVSHGDTRYELLDAGRLLTAKLRIFQINVMNNFRNSVGGWIINSGPFDQNLQSATVTLMRELRIEHVEAKFVRQHFVSLCRNELEFCIAIDEATDKPPARHAIYVNALAGNPSLALQILAASCRGLHCLLA